VWVAGAECVEVLEYEGHTAERAFGERANCFGAGLFESFVDDGIELRVQRLDAGDCRIDEFERRGLTAADERGLRSGIKWGEGIRGGHDAEATETHRSVPIPKGGCALRLRRVDR
jgi:hypothetical protein